MDVETAEIFEGQDIDDLVLSAYIGDVRELTLHDTKELQLLGQAHSGASPVTRMRAAHHVIARMVAFGFSHVEIADRVGCSAQHVGNLLRHSGAFKDLVEHYTERTTEEALNHRSKILFGAGLATELVIEQMMEQPDSISFDQKRRVMNDLLDRSGHAPNSASHVFHHSGIGRDELRAMKAESLAKEMKHYDAEYNRLPTGSSSKDAGAERPTLQEGAPTDRAARGSLIMAGPASAQSASPEHEPAPAGRLALPSNSGGATSP